MITASSSIVRDGFGCLPRARPRREPIVHAGDGKPPDLPAQVFAPSRWRRWPSVEVFPAEIQLTTARDRQSIVVQATFADGITRDVTREATITPGRPQAGPARRGDLLPGGRRRDDAFGRLRRQVGRGAGQGFAGGGHAAAQLPARRHAGLHAGRLQHGKLPRGGTRQGRLSHLALRLRPRRRPFPPDRARWSAAGSTWPSRPTARCSRRRRAPCRHTGGKRFEPSSELYQTLHGWIEAGAPNDDAAKLPTVVGVDLYPKQAVLDGKGSTQQLTVRARYSDGTDRDVTSLAVFLTNNDVSAPVSADGLVTAGERGEAFVMARFETHTVGSQFIVLPKGLTFTFPDEPEANYIDKLVNDKLKKLRIAPSGQCDDETFLRRAVDRHRRPAPDPRGI